MLVREWLLYDLIHHRLMLASNPCSCKQLAHSDHSAGVEHNGGSRVVNEILCHVETAIVPLGCQSCKHRGTLCNVVGVIR